MSGCWLSIIADVEHGGTLMAQHMKLRPEHILTDSAVSMLSYCGEEERSIGLTEVYFILFLINSCLL